MDPLDQNILMALLDGPLTALKLAARIPDTSTELFNTHLHDLWVNKKWVKCIPIKTGPNQWDITHEGKKQIGSLSDE
jgi:hypothetical protein